MHYFLIFIVVIISSLVYIKLANKFQIVDKPNHRSSHTKVTIRGGGIIFFIASLLFFFTSGFEYPFFFIGLTTLALVSFIDDLISLSALLRFSTQLVASSLLLYQSFYDFNLFLLMFLLIAAVAFINAYNFMDGINGITGIYSIIVLLSFIYINYYLVDFIDSDLLIYTLIAVIIFGFFNFRKKAVFFAGDIGSVALAFILTFAAYKLLMVSYSPFILLLFVVYGTDSLMTILKRFYLKEKLSEPHRHHIYQKLTDVLKYSHIKTSILYGFIQLIISIIVLCLFKLDLNIQWIITLILLAVFAIFYVYLNYFLIKKEKLIEIHDAH